MLSAVRKKSYGSAKVFWLDREAALESIKEAARAIKSSHPEVEEMVLFGSLAEGRATAFSDADILIIVSESAKRFIDRRADFIDYFQGIGLNIDLFVSTRREIEQNSSFLSRCVKQGIPLH